MNRRSFCAAAIGIPFLRLPQDYDYRLTIADRGEVYRSKASVMHCYFEKKRFLGGRTQLSWSASLRLANPLDLSFVSGEIELRHRYSSLFGHSRISGVYETNDITVSIGFGYEDSYPSMRFDTLFLRQSRHEFERSTDRLAYAKQQEMIMGLFLFDLCHPEMNAGDCEYWSSDE